MTDDLRFDPARKAAIRSMLHETVQQAGRREPARRRRIVLFASVTAAALVLVGGIGYAATTMGSSGPDRGFAGVDPSQTSAPVPSPSEEPGSTTVPSKDPGNVQGAGTASPTPVVAENDPADVDHRLQLGRSTDPRSTRVGAGFGAVRLHREIA